MMPVMQTRYGYPDGNCFAACVASVLELGLDEVPDISTASDDWYQRWQVWLAERNLTMYAWPASEESAPPSGYAILGTQPPGLVAGVGHAVVVFFGRVVHDPHPLDDIGPPEQWYAFGVVNAALVLPRIALGQAA